MSEIKHATPQTQKTFMNSLMEEYIHYLESMKALNRSWRVLKELQAIKNQTELWMAAYKMCLIDYCKPFKKSNGINRRFSLQTPELPKHLKKTHDYVIYIRDKALAHSDLEPLKPMIVNRIFSKNSYPPIICTDIPNFPKIELMLELVETVIIAVEAQGQVFA